MTYSGKKTSKSEITPSDLLATNESSLNMVRFQAFYTVLNETSTVILQSPVNGYLNILFPESYHACICPYFLQNESYVIRGGENIIHTVQKGDTLEWKNIFENNIAIAVFIPKDILSDFSLTFDQNINRFQNGLLTKSDNRIVLLINQIIELNSGNDQLNKFRIESIILDALVHQVEGLFTESSGHEIITNKAHYEKVILAKHIIEQDLSQNYKIPELAKIVGTNEQYLKKYFKQYFGKTVMNFITEAKMEHAKSLILSGNYRVSDVARIVGYKHPTHFTTAFKKHFGFIPNSLRYTILLVAEAVHFLYDIEGFSTLL